MTSQKIDDLRPMPEQITYANLLFFGAWTGIAVMVVTYILYAFSIVSPHSDIMVIVQNWGLSVDELIKLTHSPRGWGWINFLDKGDFLNYLGLTFLAVLTIFCYMFLIVGYRKRKDWTYFIISLLEVVVLVVAASGILGTGGH